MVSSTSAVGSSLLDSTMSSISLYRDGWRPSDPLKSISLATNSSVGSDTIPRSSLVVRPRETDGTARQSRWYSFLYPRNSVL